MLPARARSARAGGDDGFRFHAASECEGDEACDGFGVGGGAASGLAHDGEDLKGVDTKVFDDDIDVAATCFEFIDRSRKHVRSWL